MYYINMDELEGTVIPQIEELKKRCQDLLEGSQNGVSFQDLYKEVESLKQTFSNKVFSKIDIDFKSILDDIQHASDVNVTYGVLDNLNTLIDDINLEISNVREVERRIIEEQLKQKMQLHSFKRNGNDDVDWVALYEGCGPEVIDEIIDQIGVFATTVDIFFDGIIGGAVGALEDVLDGAVILGGALIGGLIWAGTAAFDKVFDTNSSSVATDWWFEKVFDIVRVDLDKGYRDLINNSDLGKLFNNYSALDEEEMDMIALITEIGIDAFMTSYAAQRWKSSSFSFKDF